MKLSLALACVAFAGLALAGPMHRNHHRHHRRDLATSEQKCAQQCSGAETKYAFSTGSTYTYEFESHTDVHIPRAAGTQHAHASNITQTATIEIAKLADCEFQMRVREINVKGTDAPKEFAQKVTEHATRFSFDDGRLSTVCADSDEAPWVVNLKRGILSTLQNAFEADEMDVDETEVAGECRAKYTHSRHGDDTVYNRRRHAHSCRGHHNMRGAVKTHAYELENSRSLGDSQHQCTHRVNKAGVLQSAQCVETHKFTPISDQQYEDTGIQSTVRSQWKLVDQTDKASVESIHFGSVQSIVYDADAVDYTFEEMGARDVQKALKQLCDSSNSFVTKSTPSEFVRLVETLRRLDEQDWQEIDQHKQAQPECDNGMKFMRDALAMCGTEKCVEEIVNLLKSGDLSQREEYEFFAALAFVPKVTLKMVKTLVPLVEREKHGLLGVSAMVHTYCVQGKERACERDEEVQQIVDALVQRIGRSCDAQALNANENEILIMSLKALGNIGRLPEDAQTTVEKCFVKKSNPISVRVAAAQATRRTPCDAPVRRHIRKVFENSNEEVELRINAFLSLMTCADEQTLEAAVEQLKVEEVKQVRAFVSSYLLERRASTDPQYKQVAGTLRGMQIPEFYDEDRSRYSYYSELGSFNPTGNTGSHVERGMIYVPGSYTPRAAYANLTAHLFGHSVNFFEMGARAEGMDHFIDDNFGADGIFTNPGSEFDREESAKSNEYLEQQKEFESRIHYESDEKFALSAYVRVFGDEILYMGFDDPNLMDKLRAKQDWKAMTDFLAKKREFNYKHNLMFIDVTKALPNAGGLPVFLKITGVSAVNMQVDGKTDLTSAMQSSSNVDIDWTIKPSMAIELSTTLYINVHGVKSGFKLLSRLHSSTAINAKLQVKDGRSLKTVLGLPQDSMKIVDFEVTGVGIVNNKEMKTVDDAYYEDKQYCTPQRFNRLLGVKSCVGLSMPEQEGALFPMRAWAGIDKVDKKLSTYEMEIQLREGRIPYPKALIIDTPGSDIDRKVMIKYDQEGETHIFEAQTPSKQLRLEGDIDTKRLQGGKSYEGKMKLTVDQSSEYKMLTQVKRVYDDGKMITELHAKTETDSEPVEVRGKLEFASLGDVALSGSVLGLNKVPTNAQLSLKIPKSGRTGDALFEAVYGSPEYDNKLEARYSNEAPSYKLALLAQVQPGASSTEQFEPMTVRARVEHLEKQHGERVEVARKIELVKSMHPASNFILTSDELRSAAHRKFGVDLKYGAALTEEASAVLEGHYQESGKQVYEGKLVVPALKIENKINAEYESKIDTKGLEINAKAKLTDLMGNNKKSFSFNHIAKMTQSPFEWSVDVQANIDNSDWEMRFFKQLNEKADSTSAQRKFTSKAIVQWAPAKQVEFNGDVDMTLQDVSYNSMNYNLQGKAKLTGVKLNGQDEFDVQKTIKMQNNHYKYVAKLSHKDKPYYDIDFDFNNEQTEKTVKSHVKSYLVDNLDYGVEAKLAQPSQNVYNIESTWLRAGKTYAQMNAKCAEPGTPNSQHRLHIQWDLDMPAKREAMIDLKKEKNDVNSKYYSTVLANVNQKEHKLTTNLEIENARSKNFKLTLVRNLDGKKVQNIEIGQDNQENSFKYYTKYQVENDPALAKRDIEINLGGNMMLKASSTEKQALSLDASFKDNLNKSNNVILQLQTARKANSKDDTYDINTLIHLEAFEVYKFAMDNDAKGFGYAAYTESSDMENNYNLLMQWAADKKIERHLLVSQQSSNGKRVFKYEDSGSSPFDGYRQYATKWAWQMDLNNNEKLQSLVTGDLEFNNEQVFKLSSTNDYLSTYDGLKLTQSVNKISTKYERVGDIKINYLNEQADKNGLDTYSLDGALEWGAANKLHFRREYGYGESKARYLALWSAKVDEQVDTKARYDYQMTDSTHKLDATVKKWDDQYQIALEFDDAQKSGKVKVVAPNTPLQTVAMKVEKTGDNEYTLSSESERGAKISGTVKLSSSHMRAHLKIDGVDTPLEIRAELKDPRSSDVVGQLVVVKNYDSEASAQKMGVKYEKKIDNAYMDADSNRGVMSIHSVTVYLHSREPHFEIRQGEAGHMRHYAIISQLDRLSERAPTKLLARYGRQQGSSVKAELELVDPALGNPFIVTVSAQRTTECPQFYQRQQQCSGEVARIEIAPSYARSQSDRIDLTVYVLRAADDARLIAVESKQTANDYQQVYYLELSSYAQLTAGRIVPTIVELGAQVLREQKLNKYALLAKAPTQQQKAALAVITPSGRQSIEYSHLDDEYRWSLVGARASQPSYTVALKVQNKTKEGIARVALELRRTPTSNTIYHTSLGLTDARTFEEETYHIDSANKKRQDTYLKLWLETDSLLKVRAHLPPASWQNLLQEVRNVDWQSAYNSNEGLLADLAHSNRRLLESVQKMQPQSQKLIEQWNEQTLRLREDIGVSADLLQAVNDIAQSIIDSVNFKIEQMNQMIADIQKNSHLMQSAQNWIKSINEAFVTSVQSIGELFQQLGQAIIESLQSFGDSVSAIGHSIAEFTQQNDVVVAIKEKLTEMIEYVCVQLGLRQKEGFFTRYTNAVKSKLGMTQSYTSQLMQFASVRRLYSTVEPALDELASIDIKSIVDKLIEYIEELASGKTVREYLPKIEYADKEQGQIELAFPLPISAASLKDLAQQVVSMEQAKRIVSNAQQRLQEIFAADGQISDDKWQRVGTRQSSGSLSGYSQTHKATAHILGRQLVTFDGKAYGVETSCEYILARDYYKNKFTIVGKFADNKGIREISLKYKQRTIAVNVDGTFKVNGEQQTLPYQYVDEFTANAYIKAIRTDRAIKISTFDQIEIECQVGGEALCTVTLPGQYYGHSNGLLGSNDQEHSNDFDLDGGESNADVGRFVDQWLVGGASCRASALPKEGTVSSSQKEECDNVFRYRRSPLRACFSRVAPKAFHQLCLNADYCEAVKAYAHACEQQEVRVQQPLQCVRCASPSSAKQLFVGDYEDVKQIRDKKADIVMVVEERPCMHFLSERIFNDAIPLPEEYKHSSDNRFGVIGYGGEEVHNAPHFHTCAQNSVQCTTHDVKQALDTLEFEPTSSTYQDQAIDPLWAVDYTVRHYPWRSQSAKVVVLFTCTECGSAVDYYRLQAEMLSQNVQLFVYTKSMIEIESSADAPSSSSVDIVGYAPATMYTNRGEQPELRPLLTTPHDSCTVLAQELNGTVFSLYDGESSAVKRSGEINAARLQYPTCQICACEQATAPRTNCVSCEVPTPVSLGESSFFNIPYVRLRNTLKKTQEQLGGVPNLFL